MMDKEDLIQLQIENDFKEVLNMKAGRRFIFRLLDDTGFRGNVFTNNGWTAFNLGKESVGKDILNQLINLGADYLTSVLYAAEKDEVLIQERYLDEEK